MTRMIRCLLAVATLMGPSVVAQRPIEFKANVKMVDASDGTTSTGVMYFGGAKIRTELSKDGQNIIVLADPVAKSQLIMMPDDKMYMELPMGQGPVNMPITGSSDPTNPCSGGSGNTDCVKGATESVNGHPAVRWEYTNHEGTRTRAWVSTKLRFPVKTEDDDGGKMEISNIAEGPQAATLFAIPAGYTKMDFGGMGMGGGRGRGRGQGRGADAGNPIAAAMANMSPEMQAAMAEAMRGGGGGRGRGNAAPAGVTGSPWESGKGWMLSLTVVGTTGKNENTPFGSRRYSYSAEYVASVPFNNVSPAAGVPGTPGPIWIYGVGLGDADVRNLPLTLSVQTKSREDVDNSKEVCSLTGGPFTSVALMTGGVKKSIPSSQPSGELVAQGMMKFAPDLKTFDLTARVSGNNSAVTEVTKKQINNLGCKGEREPSVENKTDPQRVISYGFDVDIKGIPVPGAVGPFTGSRKMPVEYANWLSSTKEKTPTL